MTSEKQLNFANARGCHFTDVRYHLESVKLKSVKHMSFAKDDKNYEALDKLIERGPSINEFVTNALKRRGYLDKQVEQKNPV